MRGDVVKSIVIGACIVIGSYQNLAARMIAGLLTGWANLATMAANAFSQLLFKSMGV